MACLEPWSQQGPTTKRAWLQSGSMWTEPSLLAGTIAASLLFAAPAHAAMSVAHSPPAPDRAEPRAEPRTVPSRWLQGLVYVDVTTGYQKLGLQTVQTKSVIPERVGTSDGGAMIGIGAGARILLASIGFRYRLGQFPGMKLS